MPGIRIEHIKAGKNTVVGLTCVTPIDENSSEVTISIVFETAPGVPPQAVAFARSSFFMFAGFGIEDLKYFLENGEPYARQFPSPT